MGIMEGKWKLPLRVQGLGDVRLICFAVAAVCVMKLLRIPELIKLLRTPSKSYP